MKIRLARSAGFCPGVRLALDKAESMLLTNAQSEAERPKPVMLGALVHNERVVDGLLERGFSLIEQAADIPENSSVLIRAHGITLEERSLLEAKHCSIEDSTCIWVQRIQKMVAEAVQAGKQVFLAGREGHPEVLGIQSYAGGKISLLQTPQDAEKQLPGDGPAALFAQTTFSTEAFEKISRILATKIAKLEIFDTICATTMQRQAEALRLARESDLMLVLGSEKSSNVGKLLSVCRLACSKTFLIQRPDQVPELLVGRDLRHLRIGITAGASTPERMIREVIQVMTENQDFSIEQEDKNELQAVEADTNESKAEGNFEFPQEPAHESGNDVAQEMNTEGNAEQAGEEPKEETQVEHMGDINFADYIEGIPQLKRGAVVKGRIVRYDDEFVYVDVRDKSEGKVPRHEFVDDENFNLEEATKNHQEIDVYVRSIKNSDMGKEILLSKAKVDFTKHKDAIEKAFEDKVPVTVKVTNVVKDGVIAAYGSVDLYIHRTQLELQVVDDLEAYRGKTMEVLITQFDPNRKRLRVSGSRRALLSKERKQKAKDVWDNIEVGKVYEGTVRNLTDFGAFVDIGGVDGLVHISELSWNRIKHPSEVISVGDKLNVFVKEFDRERKRISLGYRRPENDPYHNIEERFPLGSIVRGIVVRMFPFGAFVEIAPGVDALCHISQISNYRLNRPEDVLQEGMEVDARVLEVSNEARKISISIKEVEAIDPENPEELQVQPARRPRSENREEGQDEGDRSRRRGGRRRDHEENDGMPTTYIDTGAQGSSLSSLADFTITSDKGAEVMKSLGLDEKPEEAKETEAEAAVEAPQTEAEASESEAKESETAPATEA